MNKKVIISGVMMLVLLASCGTKEVSNSEVEKTQDTVNIPVEIIEEVNEKDTESMMKDETQTGKVIQSRELAGVYADYDSSLIGDTESTVLFFNAPWCPSCVAADKGINSGVVPEELSILKVDFDSAIDLRKKYGVVAQHTFVQVDANGEMIKKWVGGNSVEDIIERVQ